MSGTVSVLYFAWLRERVGAAEETCELPGTSITVVDLMEALAGRDARHAAAFANRRTIRCAVNQEFADPTTVLKPGDEVAFFPPVTGG